jgi:hypothetical protein
MKIDIGLIYKNNYLQIRTIIKIACHISVINSKETDNLILEEGIEIKQVDYSKYLGTIINKTEGILLN